MNYILSVRYCNMIYVELQKYLKLLLLYALCWHREKSVSPCEDFIIYPSQPDLESMFLPLYCWFYSYQTFWVDWNNFWWEKVAEMYSFSDWKPAYIATMEMPSAI